MKETPRSPGPFTVCAPRDGCGHRTPSPDGRPPPRMPASRTVRTTCLLLTSDPCILVTHVGTHSHVRVHPGWHVHGDTASRPCQRLSGSPVLVTQKVGNGGSGCRRVGLEGWSAAGSRARSVLGDGGAPLPPRVLPKPE